MRAVAASVAGLILALSATLVAASPSVAAQGPSIQSHCSAGTLCVWVNDNQSGTHAGFWDTNSNWHGLNSPWGDMANNDEAWCNLGTHPTLKGARIWAGTGHSGFWHQLVQGACFHWIGSTRPANVGSSNSWHQHNYSRLWQWSTH